MTEQAVVEEVNSESQQTSGEAENAQDESLDALLAEFDAPEQKPVEPATPTVDPQQMAEISRFMAEQRHNDLVSGLSDSAKLVKKAAGEAAANIPDYLMEGALQREAFNNPKITQAFESRRDNPEGWNKIAAALGKKIAKDLSPPDQQSTESWNAVDSAVHSASSSKPSGNTVNFNKMSDAEFQAWKLENS